MSELKKTTTRDASTYQKLPPPKSLRGDEDAEVTWDTILKRYPNAAPLLCEMEDVIERAEGLLRQLRSPYTHALERSSSFQIADSEDQLEIPGSQTVEESTEVSMISEQDSRVIDFATEVEENISESKISGVEKIEGSITSSEQRSNFLGEEEEGVAVLRDVETIASFDSEEINGVNSEPKKSSIVENLGCESVGSATASVENLIERENRSDVGKSRSLEAWGKVVGEKSASLRSSGSKVVKSAASGCSRDDCSFVGEDSVSEHTRRLTSLKSGPMQQITKLNLLGKKDEMMQRFAGTIATASKLVDRTPRSGVEEKGEIISEQVDSKLEGSRVVGGVTEPVKSIEEIGKASSTQMINESGERTDARKDFDEIDCRVEETPDESIEVDGDTEKNIQKLSEHRSPIEILDEYSKICDLPVEYKNLSPSCSYNKSLIVKCSMGGFAFEACADTKKSAKTAAAAKLLRCLTGRQIDGEITPNFIPLTRKQIEEVISLGNGGEHETAIRKLYKICVEENAPEPVYSTVQQSTSIHGNRYTVKCEALGYTTSGFGIRILIAKRVAADELLRAYHKSRNPVSQI